MFIAYTKIKFTTVQVSSVFFTNITNSLTASPHRLDQGWNCLLGNFVPFCCSARASCGKVSDCPIHPKDSQYDSNMAIWTAMVALQYYEFGRKQLSVL